MINITIVYNKWFGNICYSMHVKMSKYKDREWKMTIKVEDNKIIFQER